MFGARLGAEQALRFARGEQVTATSGLEARLSRPLDFLVIADHAVGLGIGQEIYDGNPALVADPRVARWSEMLQAGGEQGHSGDKEIINGHSAGTNPPVLSDPKLAGPIARNIWQGRGKVVERYNEPGRFSAFIGYEFTPAPGGDNLHRVVVFRDGADKTNEILPFSSDHVSQDPEDLWAALERLRGSGPAAGCLPSRTTRTCPTAACSPSPTSRVRPSTRTMRPEARALGTTGGSNPDQGRFRVAPVPVAQR